jgi:radical SAM superfamily enzyme YgiQ (UPF0313 family)
MKICLINPADTSKRNEDVEYSNSLYNMPHLGVGYIGAVLEQSGFDVDIIECMGQNINLESLYGQLDRNQYQAVGISTYYYNLMNCARIVARIKSSAPSTFVFLGGYLPTLAVEKVFERIPGADCCVIGEGEYTCVELTAALQEGRPWRTVPGIAYLENGSIQKSQARPLVQDLDELPMPKRAFISKKKMAPILTSRGCYGKCTYCGVREFYESCPGKMMRWRDPEKVVAEIEYLRNVHGVRHIFINDDNFFVASAKQKEWMRKFYELMKEKDLGMEFRIYARANEVVAHGEVLGTLKEIGVSTVFIGIESMVQRQLDYYKKAVTVEQNVAALETLRKLGIRVYIGFLMLEPFTTLAEILTNVRTLQSTRFYDNAFEGHIPISMLIPVMPILGSSFYNQLREQNRLIPGEIGYEFKDEDVKTYYQIAKVWKDVIFEIYIKYYLIFQADERGQSELAEELTREKRRLLAIDLDFIEALCVKISNQQISSQNCQDFIAEWSKQVEPIRDRFLEAQQLLRGKEV